MLKRVDNLELDYVELANPPNIKIEYKESPVNVIEPLSHIQNLDMPHIFGVGRAVPDDFKIEQWGLVPAQFVKNLQKRAPPIASVTEGRFFVVRSDGIFSSDKKIFITDVQLKILKVTRNYYWRSLEIFYDVEVFNATDSEILQIDSGKFKRIFQILRHDGRFNRFKLPVNINSPITEDYLSEVAKTADIAPIINIFHCCGWLEIDGKMRYCTVTSEEYYQRCNFNSQEKKEIFKSGNSWLDVGHNATVNILWLIAHSQFLQYFFKRANVRQEFLVFLKGVSGTLKTSTIKTISDPFRNDRELAINKIASSTAAIEDILTNSRDMLIVFDDISFTEGTDIELAKKNVETIIRAVGDNQIRSKKNLNNFSKVSKPKLQCTVVITGEQELPLDKSSYNRILTLEVDEGTFNGTVLAAFQQNPRTLQNYFDLFCHYLENQIESVIANARTAFETYRQKFRNQLKGNNLRLIDTAAYLTMVADIVIDFANWVGIDQQNQRHIYSSSMEQIVLENLKQRQQVSPTVRFLQILWQQFGNVGFQIATSEDMFIANPNSFIGYETQDQVIINFNSAYITVKNVMRQLGIPFNEQVNELKKKLAYVNAIDYQKNNDGTMIFSFKMSRETVTKQRLHLMRFNKSVCEKLINSLN